MPVAERLKAAGVKAPWSTGGARPRRMAYEQQSPPCCTGGGGRRAESYRQLPPAVNASSRCLSDDSE